MIYGIWYFFTNKVAKTHTPIEQVAKSGHLRPQPYIFVHHFSNACAAVNFDILGLLTMLPWQTVGL